MPFSVENILLSLKRFSKPYHDCVFIIQSDDLDHRSNMQYIQIRMKPLHESYVYSTEYIAVQTMVYCSEVYFSADGAWSAWTTWSACDVTCQNGTKTRSRACDNPAPVNGGATCDGPSSEPMQCATGVGCPGTCLLIGRSTVLR